MTNEELDHARAELEALGADWALLSAPENVTYVSHYEAPIDFGARSHPSYGPVLALVGVREGTALLLANHYYAGAARAATTIDEVIGFGILEVFEPYAPQAPRENFVGTLQEMVRQAGLGSGKVRLAIEERTLSWWCSARWLMLCRRWN
jgi:Xaa-Pro aminopeptidase